MSDNKAEKYLPYIFQINDQYLLYIKNSCKSICKRQILWLQNPLPEIHPQEISLEMVIIVLPLFKCPRSLLARKTT